MHSMTNEASPTIRILGQGGCGKSPVFKRIGHKAYRRGYWFLHQSCPCAVPIGLRNRLVESLFPTLKRGANQLCASGAFMPTFLMQSQYSFTLFCCIYGTTESLSANCSAGFQTGCTGGFQAARDGGCRPGGLADSRSGGRPYKFRNLRISSKSQSGSKPCKLNCGRVFLSTDLVRYAAAAVSDVGSKRASNEDAFGLSAEYGVYVVCDGMGGAAAGEIA